MNLDKRDFLLRGLFIVCGAVSAILLALQGHGEALPALAIGGVLGVYCVGSVETGERE